MRGVLVWAVSATQLTLLTPSMSGLTQNWRVHRFTPEWSKLLNSSAITKEDYERNPQAVFEVLEFYSDITKRAQNPNQYPSLTPTPPATSNQNKQLGYGMNGTSIAPPRPTQPNNSTPQTTSPSSGTNAPRRPTPPETQQQRQQTQQTASNYVGPDSVRSSVKTAEAQRQRDREVEEQNRRDMEAYNASLPKTRTPIAKQEIGGYGGGSSSDRYNPSRAAPPTPRQAPQTQASPSLRAQRQAPSAPTSSNAGRPPIATQQNSSSAREQNGGTRSPARTDPSSQRPRNLVIKTAQTALNNHQPALLQMASRILPHLVFLHRSTMSNLSMFQLSSKLELQAIMECNIMMLSRQLKLL